MANSAPMDTVEITKKEAASRQVAIDSDSAHEFAISDTLALLATAVFNMAKRTISYQPAVGRRQLREAMRDMA